VRLCHYDNRWSGIEIELDLDSRLPAWYASENQFKQVCMHVLENALDALQDRQDARLRLQTRLDTEHGIVISFEDNGNGVDEDKLQTIFEPFYSTKAVGGGTGLGLAICLAIVESFDGAIRAEQACGGGLRIVIELPLGNSAHPEIAA
ncbi:MAG TPA: ATP-binding protein, partial [Gammaproteobacteria bacterium]